MLHCVEGNSSGVRRGSQARPPRLALARVSLLRGSGPRAGEPFLDDYIRASEPVADYLTKWSGINAGDLEPAVSRKHLVTAKAAYLKLRYLVDCGCVFVGHGLKKDFRMINIIVPPEQVSAATDACHHLVPYQRSVLWVSDLGRLDFLICRDPDP